MKLVATEEDQEHLNNHEDSASTWKLVARGYPRNPGTTGKSGDSETEGNDDGWPHNLHNASNYVLHMEKVFSIVRRRYGRSPTDQMKDLGVYSLFKLQFILGKITRKTYGLQRINFELFVTVFFK